MPIRPSLFLPGRQKFPCKTCKKGSQECSNCSLSFFYTIGMFTFSSLTIFPYNIPKKKCCRCFFFFFSKAWFSLLPFRSNFEKSLLMQQHSFCTKNENSWWCDCSHKTRRTEHSCSSFNFWLIIMSLATLGKNARHVKIPTTLMLLFYYCSKVSQQYSTRNPFSSRLSDWNGYQRKKKRDCQQNSKTSFFSITVFFYEID